MTGIPHVVYPDRYEPAPLHSNMSSEPLKEFIIAVIVMFAIFIPVALICGHCSQKEEKKRRREAFSNLREIFGGSQQVELPEVQQPPPANMFPAVQPVADGPTMERFFNELAQDRPERFSAQQLHIFTQNYSTVLGSGGYGKVYWGQLPNGVKIAVKILNRGGGGGGGRIEQQFMAEVGTIGRTNHFNLVRLYGFCYDQHMSALVYEFMENGSLDRHLFKNPSQLTWEKLHGIAVGVAKGIAYLHEECQQRIVHYDIKTGNVLLDNNFFPKVADFGLAKLCNRDATHITDSCYRGTPGYSAPECMRRNVQDGNDSDDSLDWFPKQLWEEYEKGKLKELLEACKFETRQLEQATRMAMAALWCIQTLPEQRPLMSTVVKLLDAGMEIMPPPKPSNYFSIPSINILSTINSSEGRGSGYTRSDEQVPLGT